jgi:hypothetical protein
LFRPEKPAKTGPEKKLPNELLSARLYFFLDGKSSRTLYTNLIMSEIRNPTKTKTNSLEGPNEDHSGTFLT